MKYRFEYCGNPTYVSLHVSVRLVEKFTISGMEDRNSLQSMELLNLLQGVAGVQGDVSLRPYEITAVRAMTFSREEVLTSMLDMLVMWLKMQGLIAEDEPLEQGTTIRTDIAVVQCPMCAREQEEAMRGGLSGDMDMNDLRGDD